ncbi:hypothetical protein ACFPMF_03555 [Larkinella bovis]|uniref:T9SS type A sorting domain-containing protein n=1 Tax=Larkinella bovis TaxID=683041 RepID=A0ABW0I4T4_9BACT
MDRTKTSSQPYWQMNTDYKTNGTTIRYYNADQHLMHQEVLPNRLVKLTRGNVRRLNETLLRIAQNQPKGSSVQSVTLPPNAENARMVRARNRNLRNERLASQVDVFARIVPSANENGAGVKVYFYNPHEENLRIDILNQQGRVVCTQYESRFQGGYRFNMAMMPEGDYRVQIVKIRQQTPCASSLFTLSRKPSQTLITSKSEATPDSSALVAK